MPRVVYLNGDYVPETEARISIFDCALMYGDMVFEMTRAFNQRPFRLEHHLDRLYGSLRYAGIDCGLDQAQMLAATHETIERNLPAVGDLDFQIMHNVTRGGMDLYAELVKEGTSSVVTINVFPLVRHIGRSAAVYDNGAHFVTPRQQSVPARFIDPKAKNRSRIFYKLAELEAERMEPGAMALLTDERGFVTEGTGNNFFMARGGEIFTPKPHDILRGVSRQYCIELAQEAGDSAARGGHRAVRRARGGRGVVREHHHLHAADHALQLRSRGRRQAGADLPPAAGRLVAERGRRHRGPGQGVRRDGRLAAVAAVTSQRSSHGSN